jgi:hypothetical protein
MGYVLAHGPPTTEHAAYSTWGQPATERPAYDECGLIAYLDNA